MRLAIYLALIALSVALPHPVTRALPLLSLAFFARGQRLFALGLLCSAIGDGVFKLSFVSGLGCFLTAHLFYIATFARRFAGRRKIATILLVAAVAAYACVIVPAAGSLKLPVAAYAVVIAAMGATAFLSDAKWLLPLGASLFVLSDSLLALTIFVVRHPMVAALVSPTYFAAQFLLMLDQTALRSAASSRGRQASTS